MSLRPPSSFGLRLQRCDIKFFVLYSAVLRMLLIIETSNMEQRVVWTACKWCQFKVAPCFIPQHCICLCDTCQIFNINFSDSVSHQRCTIYSLFVSTWSSGTRLERKCLQSITRVSPDWDPSFDYRTYFLS